MDQPGWGVHPGTLSRAARLSASPQGGARAGRPITCWCLHRSASAAPPWGKEGSISRFFRGPSQANLSQAPGSQVGMQQVSLPFPHPVPHSGWRYALVSCPQGATSTCQRELRGDLDFLTGELQSLPEGPGDKPCPLNPHQALPGLPSWLQWPCIPGLPR